MSVYARIEETPAGRRHLTGVPPQVIERIRHGANETCWDCGAPSLAGGLRCLPCFLIVAEPVRGGCGTNAGYTKHRRSNQVPCQACREAHAAYNYDRRAS